jgi:hypothetical protein
LTTTLIDEQNNASGCPIRLLVAQRDMVIRGKHMLKTQSTMLAFGVTLTAAPASGNIIYGWDATGEALIQGNAPAPPRIGGPTGGMRITPSALERLVKPKVVNR